MTAIHVRLREWETTSPDRADLRGVFLDDAARQTAYRLADKGVVEISELRTGLRVQAFAHVGRIQLGDLTVTIEPKLAAGELFELLRYAYGLRNLTLFSGAGYAERGQLLQDLVAAQLRDEVRELVARGLARRYVARAEPLRTPRGRIDMDQLVRQLPLVDAALPCRHHARSPDHVLNQAIHGALALAATIASDRELRGELLRLAATLAVDVTAVRLDAQLLRRAWTRVDRTTVSYEPTLRLAELLLACNSIALDGDATLTLPGFLFDMNRFFEALVGRLLRDHLPELEVVDQNKLTGMMRYRPQLNPRRRHAPTPRPDFALMRERRIVALLDAKYRDLWERSLPREMLYQLAMYAVSQPAGSTAAIIYPTTDFAAADAEIELRAPDGSGVLGYVALRPLVLPALAAALRDRAGTGAVAAAAVRAVAFGARTVNERRA